MTGIAGIDIGKLDLREGVRHVMQANEDIAALVGIGLAARCTTIKPEGTQSTVMGTSSGVHCWYSPYFIRRVRISKTEPIYQYLMDNNPEIIEDDMMNPTTTAVASFYIKAPDDAVCRKDETALEFLERVKRLNLDRVRAGPRSGTNFNNVSCTVNVKESEWDDVMRWMWDNRESYTGISLMPYSDSNYKQAPFEEITEAEYLEGGKLQKNLDLSKIIEEQNFVNFTAEAACSASGCEVV